MPKKRISDDPKKERSDATAGRVLSERSTKRERSRAGGVLSGASAATGAGEVTVPSKRVHIEAAFPAAGALSVDEAKVLQDIIRERVRLPEDMHWGDFRVGEDSTGEPAVWIVVVAHDDLKPSKSKIASLQRAREEVRSIVHSQTNRWPYIEIATQ
jgi:hypothetical protein